MNDIYIDEHIVQKNIEKWGIEPQTRQAMEECAELIQAANKNLRGKRDDYHLAEEIADVAICLQMLCQVWQIDKIEVQKWIDKKQCRTLERIYTEGKAKDNESNT